MSKFEQMSVKERVKYIADFYVLSGSNASEIAKDIEASSTTVYEYLKKSNTSSRPLSEASRTFVCDHNFFDKIDTEEKAYWLGFLKADACIIKNQIRINLKDEDIEVLEKLKISLKSDYPILFQEHFDKRTKKIYKKVFLCITSDRLVNKLKKYSVVPRKTQKEVYQKIRKNLQIHYIRGLIDGDGSFCYTKNKNAKNGKEKRFSLCGSLSVCEGVQDFFVRSGLLKKTKIRFHTGCYVLDYNGSKQVQKVHDAVYLNSNIFLKRKKEVFL